MTRTTVRPVRTPLRTTDTDRGGLYPLSGVHRASSIAIEKQPKTTYSAEWRRLVAEAIANGARCVDCGTTRSLEGDHELPVSRGGLSTRANLTVRCRRHNRAKGNRVTRYQLRVPWPVTTPLGGTVDDAIRNVDRGPDLASDTPTAGDRK